MPQVRPRFFLGTASSLTFPLATVSGLSLVSATPAWRRAAAPMALLHQEKTFVDDRTAAAQPEVTIRLGYSGTQQGRAHAALWLLKNTIGTTKAHLWIVDDDQYETITVTANESAGAQTVQYDGTAVSWFATGDYLLISSNGVGSDEEVVVVTGKNDGTPSFSATLAYPHDLGATCYRVACCYPNALLTSIQSSELPLGKGSLVLTFAVQDVPIYGTALPS